MPVPKIIVAEAHDGYNFLLMTKLSGEMSCSYANLKNIESTVIALAKGLKMLWGVDVANCPCVNSVHEKLIQARYNIDNNLVDVEDFNPETFTTEGFTDISGLYEYLEQNRPAEDLVFSHGDFCLPNIFVSGENVTGFVDWGNGGIADRWQDIALCVRSLKHNYIEDGLYNENDYQKYRQLFFHELGIVPNEEKIRYFILMDELF